MDRRDLAAALAVAAAYFAYQAAFLAWRRLPMVDEGVVWLFADEILRGRLPYRDFHCEYTPLAFYVHAAYAAVAGPDLWPGRLWITGWAAAGAAAAYVGARAFAGRAASAAIGLAVAVSSFAYHAYVSYNVMATALALVSTALVLHAARTGRTPLWAAGGVAAGLVFWTKQNTGGLVGLGAGAAALVEAIRRRRPGLFGAYAATALGALAAGAAALGLADLLGPFVEQAIVWPFTRVGALPAPYPTDQVERLADFVRSPSLRTYDALAHAWSFVMVFVAPVVCWAVVRGPVGTTAAALGLAGALGAWHEPTTWHIAFARPLPTLAAGAVLSLWGETPRRRLAAAALAAAFFATHVGRQAMIFDGHTAEIRAERAAGIKVRPWEARWIDDVLDRIDRVPAGETYWIAWVDLLYYHLVDHPLPVHTTFIEPDVAMATGQDRNLIEDLDRNDVRWVLHPRGRNDWYDLGRLPALRRYLREGGFEETSAETIAGGAGRITVYRRRVSSPP